MGFLQKVTICLGTVVALTIGPMAQVALAAPKVVAVGSKHYLGTWLEIARRPMLITDGCVAGYTTYRRAAEAGKVKVEDGCHEGTPDGKLKTIEGEGTLLDAGTTNAKLSVRYPLLITFEYWVVYQAPDRSWFISVDPGMKNLWIYSRSVPSKKKLATMVRKAKALGYDTDKLEFPTF